MVILRLQSWLYLYIAIQVILILAKLAYLIRIAEIGESFIEKLRIIIKSIPYINTSFGYNELGIAGVLNIVSPTKKECIEKKIQFTQEKIIATIRNDNQKLNHIEKAQRKFESKSYFLFPTKKQ